MSLRRWWLGHNWFGIQVISDDYRSCTHICLRCRKEWWS